MLDTPAPPPTSPTRAEIELYELIALSESSSQKIAELTIQLLRFMMQTITLLLVFLSILVLFVFAVLPSIADSSIYEKYKIVTTITIAIPLLGFILFSGYIFSSKKFYFDKLVRQVMVEEKIHRKLITMIDEQYRRVTREDNLPPIALATIDIRIMRLDNNITL